MVKMEEGADGSVYVESDILRGSPIYRLFLRF